MENLSLVAAIGKNNELGLDNHLIWRIKEDLQFYRNLTIYENIIMGRKTFYSMPSKALMNRNPFVLSSSPLDKMYDVNSFSSVDDILRYIENTDQHFIVVGGAQIYELFMPYVNTMFLTEIDDYATADTFFPHIDVSKWNVDTIYKHDSISDLAGDVSYVRNKYVRKREK